MQRDLDRQPGFYWVRFEGEPVVAEYTLGHRSKFDYSHWHIPSGQECYEDALVCELLSRKLLPPKRKSSKVGI